MGRLSFHSCALWQLSVEDAIQTVANLGYDGVELNMETAPHFRPHVLPNMPRERRVEIAESLLSSEIGLSSLSAHVSLCNVDAERRTQSLAFVKGALDLAADLGTDVVHVYSGPVSDGAHESKSWEVLIDCLKHSIDSARDCGVRLAVEAVAFPGFLVWNLQTMLELLERIDDEELFVNFDPSHYFVAGDSVVEAFDVLSERIVHVHAKDANGDRDNFEFPPVGHGEVDWRGLAETMAAEMYSGFVSVEYEGNIFGYGDDTVVAAKEARAFLLNALGEWIAAQPIGE